MPGDRRSIAAVTSSRADYGHLYWPMKAMLERPEIDLSLWVTGAHLSHEFGRTVEVIERDGFPVAERIECLLSSDSDVAMAKTIGLATTGFADALGRARPDLLLVIADRYEMLAPAAAALALRIPMVHIEGGDASEGAIDHVVRNAITMMSHVHLTPTPLARRRVIAMGEEPWRVHCTGAPSLDHLYRSLLPDRPELEGRLGIDLSRPPVVVAYHPVTLARETTEEVDAVFAALEQVDGRLEHSIAFCFPNADAGSRRIIERARAFCAERRRAHLFVNLEPVTYWGLLRHAAFLLGNSSSGIMESPSLGLPAINIGRRQDGRERAPNVIDVPARVGSILEAVARATNPAFRDSVRKVENPYGDGRASERIATVLAELEVGDHLLVKRAPQLANGCSSADGP